MWKDITFCTFHLILISSVFSRSKLQKTRDFVFATASFPIGVFVAVMFWSLFYVDRELVFPARFDPYIPPLENHLLHTSVFVLQLLELTTTPHFYPSRRKLGMSVTGLLCMGYLIWVCYIAHFGGFWVYPVLKVLKMINFKFNFVS